MFAKRSIPNIHLLIIFLTLLALTFSSIGVTPVYAANYTVTKTADTNDGTCDGDCSLREAITAANAAAGTDAISLPAGIYTLTFGSQLPAVTSIIIINGGGAANTFIEANASANTATYRVFEVTTTGGLTLDSLTVRNGRCNGSCAYIPTNGGGILNGGSLIVFNVTFSANSATNSGGGMFNYLSSPILTNVTFSANSADTGGGMYNYSSSPTLKNVTFNGNSAVSWGGGMYNDNSSSPTLTDVTFSANTATIGGGMYNTNSSPALTKVTFSANGATNYGGGMYNNSSSPTLTDVTFSYNSASSFGGGMYNDNSSPALTNVTFSANGATFAGGGMYNTNSSPTLTDVTFSANSANTGGGMYNTNSTPALTNVTFSANSAGIGGGMVNDSGSSPTLKNTLIADSPSGGDCVNNATSTLNAASSNNLIQNPAYACGLTNGANGNIIGQDPVLGALANNGGFTQTHSLLAGSPAIDAGTNTGCPATDQRGMLRPLGGICDIGAYETVQAYFADVPTNYWSWSYVERLRNAGITGGCSAVPLNYCPTTPVTRAQMAIFLLRGMHGSTYTPPAATGTVFNDVPLGTFAAAWIEQLATEGITSGCGGNNYCPNTTVSRAQMAIFLVRAKHGVAFVPPTAAGIFGDVPIGSFGANFIEQLVTDGITSGCSSGNFCPNTMVKRDSMAVFLVKAFNLP